MTRELQRQIAAQEVTLRDQEVALDQVTQRGEGVAVVVVVVETSLGGFFDCHCH